MLAKNFIINCYSVFIKVLFTKFTQNLNVKIKRIRLVIITPRNIFQNVYTR